ncbi:uncharacterized protein LOC119399861 [Rhipicephalus sanguineus]|uniref:uncharacterized protein LOC119399861 n=1 Tax=Rhipicephalus sanguineus TaxID=34632 RepID=UPI001892EB2C|nr:uncharacterized protein LOC119399861 [Rhipicephalus sanguineus]
MKAAFTEYLEANSTLERLRIYSTQDDFLKSVLTGMRTNKSVSNLNLFFRSFNSETFRLLEGVFSENVVLRSLTISIVSEHIASAWEEGLEGWLKGLAQNRGLQYMRFPFVIKPQGGWSSLFEAVSTHRSLKEVVVELLDPHYYEVPGFNDYGRQDRLYYALLDACKILENSGAKDKVKFVFKASCPYTLDNDASVPRPFSLPVEAMTRPSMDLLEQSLSIASCRMTELRVELPFLRRNSSAVVQYIKETTTLRKLFLSDRIELNEAGMDSIWSAILESLSENASIREVTVYARSDCAESLERLGEIVKSSRTIRALNIYALQSLQMVPRYAGRSPIEISSNYSLCSFRLLPDRDMMGMWAFDWSAWYNTAWRNSGIVARAARFVKCTMCDRRCAGALETVSRHPALMEELAEVLSLSDAELASLVRTRLREIQNVHDFMRLAGVVKDTVTCQPREDGRKQLHDLNEYCWGHVRRYLLFDDVRDSFETAHYVALQ